MAANADKTQSAAATNSEARFSEFATSIHDRYFEDYAPGSVFRFGPVSASEPEIIEFAEQFDPQRMHVDREFAAGSALGGIIASGWHTAGLVMRLLVDNFLSHVATLPSPGLDELRWVRPVYPGDALWVRVSILEATASRSKPDRGVVKSFVEAVNQDGHTVMKFTVLTIFRRRHPS